ncbi:MAG TPA: MBL fold metallo-hydrolase, partial [Longimicrobiaceae bacterium]|nr:MBL fold metallo-hydrolase [Longimicrobiaceae bacterium]
MITSLLAGAFRARPAWRSGAAPALILALSALLVAAAPAAADVVVPSPEVTTRVVVRAGPSSESADVGSLRPGEQAELLGSVPNWHEVRLADGTRGFVSKRWTRVIPGPAAPAPTFTVHVFDVGTGLAVLVQGADFTLLYDGGSNDDLARGEGNRLLAYLRAAAPSLATIDHVVLSHPHRDHVELLPDVLARYQVRQVWDSGRVNDICGYRAFLTAVRDEPGVQYHNALQDLGTRTYSFAAKTCYGQPQPAAVLTLTQASRITLAPVALGAGASMSILYADGSLHSNPNENSVVVRLDLGDRRVLLMGDADAGGRELPSEPPTATSIEGALVACCAGALGADVLVVGHHGSMTSSRQAFLNAVGATVFVVSSGPMRYGTVTLPDPAVIAELTARGQVLRTDVDDAACALNPAKIG